MQDDSGLISIPVMTPNGFSRTTVMALQNMTTQLYLGTPVQSSNFTAFSINTLADYIGVASTNCTVNCMNQYYNMSASVTEDFAPETITKNLTMSNGAQSYSTFKGLMGNDTVCIGNIEEQAHLCVTGGDVFAITEGWDRENNGWLGLSPKQNSVNVGPSYIQNLFEGGQIAQQEVSIWMNTHVKGVNSTMTFGGMAPGSYSGYIYEHALNKTLQNENATT